MAEPLPTADLGDPKPGHNHYHSLTNTAVNEHEARLAEVETTTIGGAVEVHRVDTSDVHGIPDTAPLVTPQVAGVASVRALGTGATQALPGNHSSTTDARTPTAHNQDAATITTGTLDAARVPTLDAAKIGTGTLAPARVGTGIPDGTKFLRDDGAFAALPSGGTGTPTAHAGSHATAGTDALTPAAIGAPTVARLDGINPDGQRLLAVSPQPAAPYVIATAPTGFSTPSAVLGGAEVRQPVASSLAVGAAAQRSLTTGINNVAVGLNAQLALTTGGSDIAIGSSAQSSLTTGANNIAIGTSAQFGLTTGINNVAVGHVAQSVLTTGTGDVAVGSSAQRSLTTGINNVAVGSSASFAPGGTTANATVLGHRNTHIGTETGANDATDPSDTTAVGYRALVSGAGATAIGSGAKALHAGAVAIGMGSTTVAVDQVMVGPRDIEITAATKGVIQRSPNGTRWRLAVSDTGAGTFVAA